MDTYIGKTTDQIESGQTVNALKTQDMAGRIFKPGRHMVDGKMEWVDKVGTPDERIMAFPSYGFNFYKVYQNAEEFFKDWRIDPVMLSTHHSARIKEYCAANPNMINALS